MKHKFLRLLSLAAVMIAGLSSCVYDDDLQPCQEPANEGRVKLRLKFQVPSAETTESLRAPNLGLTRADDDYSFEQPDKYCENISSLRIIIARTDSVTGNVYVEHNRMVSLDNFSSFPQAIAGEEFEVAKGEMKDMYLIANEQGAGSEIASRLSGLAPGVPMSNIYDMIITSSDAVLADNTAATEETVRMLPMAEVFHKIVNGTLVKQDDGHLLYEQEENLFLPRAAVKFSFTISADEDAFWPETDAEGKPTGIDPGTIALAGREWEVTAITVTGLANAEFLFPTATKYLPEKGEPSTNPYGGRIVTEYTCPDGVSTGSYTFTPSGFGINAPGSTAFSNSYSPALYFFESPIPAGNAGYTVSLTIKATKSLLPPSEGDDDTAGDDETEGDDETTGDDDAEEYEFPTFTFPAVKLPNLASLPRNTHVRVNMKITANGLKCEAWVLPYISVVLEPDFGILYPEEPTP